MHHPWDVSSSEIRMGRTKAMRSGRSSFVCWGSLLGVFIFLVYSTKFKNPPFWAGQVVFWCLVDYRFRRTPALGLTIVLYIVPMASVNSVNALGTLPVQMQCQHCKNLEPTETSVRATAPCLRGANNLSRCSCWLDGYSIQQLCTNFWICARNTNIFFMILSFQRKNQPLAV